MAGTEQRGEKPASAFSAGIVLGWAWTLLSASAGAILLFQPGLMLPGLILILSALAACPLTASLLEKQSGTKLGGGLRLALAGIFAGLAGLSIAQNPASWQRLTAAAAPKAIPPKILVEESGDFGNKTTKLFTPQGKDWDLQWSFNCNTLGDSGNFNAQIMRQGGAAYAAVEKINDYDEGIEHYHDAGTFYLHVVSECRWDVKVMG